MDKSRVYYDAEKMAEAEAGKIDFVSICTPNFVHYSAAKTFLEHGINVVCEKPLTLTVEEAEDLARIAKEKNLVFAVDYCYSGYVMCKVMKQMIARGRHRQDHFRQRRLHRGLLPGPAVREGAGKRPHLAHRSQVQRGVQHLR